MIRTTSHQLTAEEFSAWLLEPDQAGQAFELVNGGVVAMPSPTRFHGTVVFLLARLLGNYLFERGSGSIATNDSGLLVKRNPDTVRGPDLMLFLSSTRLEDIPRRVTDTVPELVVEVLSPSDGQTRTLRRISEYHERGVPLVWVIDPEERTVHVCRPNEFPQVLDEGDPLTGSGVLPNFECRVRELFLMPGQA